jgi:Protein of unknown function (DUF835)
MSQNGDDAVQIEVRPGALYFLKGKEDGRVRELVAGLGSAGYRWMVVSARSPDLVHNDLGGQIDCILTLTESVGQDSVDPQNLMVLADTITKFIENDGRSALLIEDLELLKEKNEFSRILRLVGFVYESLAINRGIGFIMMDPLSWDAKETAHLSKEGNMVEEKDRLELRPVHPRTSGIHPSQNV